LDLKVPNRGSYEIENQLESYVLKIAESCSLSKFMQYY
jgi:hypothetical protein